QAFLSSSAGHDRSIRQACVTLLRNLFPVVTNERRQSLEAKVHDPGLRMACAHAYATTDPVWALSLLEPILQKPHEEAIRLEAIRVLQIALGDIGAAWARGTIWEGYTRHGPQPQKSTLDLARKLVLKAISSHPEGDFYREVVRTAALLEMDVSDV